jgi:predicted metal-dependent peptidase
MKFTKIFGKASPDLIQKAEDKMSAVFTDLSLSYDNKALGSGIGGDYFVFQLVYPLPHILDCTELELKQIERDIDKQLRKDLKKVKTEEEKEVLSDEVRKFKASLKGKVLRTAATDGKKFYWSLPFVLKQSKLGLRIVMEHEAWHAIYMHPSRRGSRNPQLWNIAVDYKVNFTIMEDLKARDIKDPSKVFTESLGEFITLQEYADFLKNPFQPPPRLAHLNPMESLRGMADPAYAKKGEKIPPMYFADANLDGDFKKPEIIYDYLLKQIPKCPECGKLGMYKKPEEYKKLQKQIEDNKKKEEKKNQGKDQSKNDGGNQCNDPNHNHSDDGQACNHPGHNPGDANQPSNNPGGNGQGQPQQGNGQNPGQSSPSQNGKDGEKCDHGCSTCGDPNGDSGYFDPFGAGDTLDSHMDSDISEDELGKRMAEAVESARKMAGKIPGGLSDELGELIAPKLTWQDFIRAKITRMRKGFGKNDWQSPKSKPMFAGLFVPQKRDYFVNILAAYDCSGSMSTNDIAYGISQLQAIDERGEISLLPWDTVCYWNDMVKIRTAKKEELKNAKVKGRGGTMCRSIFEQYDEHCDKLDIIVVITDGWLGDSELKDVKPKKGVDVVWIITSHNPQFRPPFGRVFNLHNE